MIYFFDEIKTEHQAIIGAKGGVLARLYQAGYPVPNGFVILPGAFDGDNLKPSMWQCVQDYVTILRKNNGDVPFAVRSSAQGEDSAQVSFAGQFETVLNVSDEKSIQDALYRVRHSGMNDHVRIYGELKHSIAQDISVIIQVMIKPAFSGVLFSADPLTGSRNYIVGNFVYGLGDKLVSGETNAEAFTIKRLSGKYDGPSILKGYARELYKLTEQLEKAMGCPQDIEWAIANGKLYLLQTRPITTLRGHNTVTGEWNDSLQGDYLWTSTNWGEAVPEVMTPFTWSIFLRSAELSSISLPGNHPSNGNIGGRLYFNASLFISMASALGLNVRKLLEYGQETFGQLPSNVHIPIIPFSAWDVIRTYGFTVVREWLSFRKRQHQLPLFLSRAHYHANELRYQINSILTKNGLINYWFSEIEPFIRQTNQMMDLVVSQMLIQTTRIRRELTGLVEPSEVNLLLSGINQGQGNLTSLQPLLCLSKVACGEMSRSEYLERYGHRCHVETEVSRPRPCEEPFWVEKQIAEFNIAKIDILALLARQQQQHEIARQRFQSQHPHRADAILRRIDITAEQARIRESVRSEFARMFWVIRTYALRSGELTGLGDDIFFLLINEVHDILSGNEQATSYIPARRETHRKYSMLPAYPVIISGRFDPISWAKNPFRRNDIFDSHGLSSPPTGKTIIGIGGSPGVVEGVVRNISNLDDANQLQMGEILVTRLTNIGWTILFTRAAAIITDIGAPLSHAAIVARELGIPMVVGCGDASSILKTGDHVRIDGEYGTVEIIKSRGQAN